MIEYSLAMFSSVVVFFVYFVFIRCSCMTEEEKKKENEIEIENEKTMFHLSYYNMNSILVCLSSYIGSLSASKTDYACHIADFYSFIFCIICRNAYI